MACDVQTLLEDACTNEFRALAENRQLSQGVILQLAYQAAGGGESLDDLYAQACANGFNKLNPKQWRSALLSVLCSFEL